MSTAPGSYAVPVDRWGRFEALARAHLPEGALVVVDERVVRLHPKVKRAIAAGKPRAVVSLKAGEGAKTLRKVEKLLSAGMSMPRSGTLVVVGGGTLGDLATVAAHLLKRGVTLIQVPTTVLAAVDSSLGGKGAVHVSEVKNAAGVFHYAAERWLCLELFETLAPAQHREGQIEAWKMVASLDARRWKSYRRRAPSLETLLRDARELKMKVCQIDPYEKKGSRGVLNFGHTFGHVIESLTHFGVSHGDAVGLGIYCALDVGRALGVTPSAVAGEVELGFLEGPGIGSRKVLARALREGTTERVSALLGADKKAGKKGELRMVLLTGVGLWTIEKVEPAAWRALLPRWRSGA
jgi:3-dehydroquinate synthase